MPDNRTSTHVFAPWFTSGITLQTLGHDEGPDPWTARVYGYKRVYMSNNKHQACHSIVRLRRSTPNPLNIKACQSIQYLPPQKQNKENSVDLPRAKWATHNIDVWLTSSKGSLWGHTKDNDGQHWHQASSVQFHWTSLRITDQSAQQRHGATEGFEWGTITWSTDKENAWRAHGSQSKVASSHQSQQCQCRRPQDHNNRCQSSPLEGTQTSNQWNSQHHLLFPQHRQQLGYQIL